MTIQQISSSSGIQVINNLTSNSTTNALSADMGKSLEDNKLPKTSNRIIPNASIIQANNYKTATINSAGNAVEASPNIPPLTTTQRDSISTKFTGLTIFNTTTGKIETWNGSAWIGVSADQIGDGSVSNTEFQYINTLTSNAQDQIDLKKLNAQQNTLSAVTVNTTNPTTIASTTITPRNNSQKVLLLATGDGNPNQDGGYHRIKLYRDSTAIEPHVIIQNAGGNSANCPFALSTIDSPSSNSSITYTVKAYQPDSGSGSFTYGEEGSSHGTRLIAIDFQP
jgi:hypothetical protein